MLLIRYGSIDAVMRLPYRRAAQLIKKAYEKNAEDKAWQMWLQLYPDMIIPRMETRKGNKLYRQQALDFISFSEFLERIKRPTVSHRPAEEILTEAEQIRQSIAARKEAAKA